MIGNLTLYMNKVRQAAITREIIEVVSGAQAAADINIGESWAVNIGLKYLDADATLDGVVDDSGRNVTIDVNPLMFRVMAVFRF